MAKAKTGIFQNGVIGKCTTLIMHILEKAQPKLKPNLEQQKLKKQHRAKTGFTTSRTAHYKNHKDNLHEKVEFVKSGNMPSFAEKRPDLFWEAAHIYERKNARTAASQVIALPKELSVQQRIELAEALIKQFTDEFNFPYTAAIHNHTGEIGGQDQPHLHIMYCERSVDEHNRTAEQFFSRYNDKDPASGGAQRSHQMYVAKAKLSSMKCVSIQKLLLMSI